MSAPLQTDSARNPDGIRAERVPDSALNKPASQPSSNSPEYGTDAVRATRAIEQTVAAKVNGIDPRHGLAAVLVMLRPDWRPEAVYAAIVGSVLPARDLVPLAVRLALDPETRHPGRITTADARPATPVFPRAPRCPHGVLADPDGRGTGCEGCGTRAVPMPAGLRVLPRAEGDA